MAGDDGLGPSGVTHYFLLGTNANSFRSIGGVNGAETLEKEPHTDRPETPRLAFLFPLVELDLFKNSVGLAVSVLVAEAVVLVARPEPPGHSTVFTWVAVPVGSAVFDVFIVVVAAHLFALSEKYLGTSVATGSVTISDIVLAALNVTN